MKKRQIEFVTKISKHCNLRCSYCYEYNDLADTRRLSLENAARILRNLKDYSARTYGRACFIWHGGEPFLIKPSYYEQIGELQQEIFGSEVSYWNLVQSNLTVLSEPMLDFIEQQKFFYGLGVSVDPFGDERVDIKGRQTREIVLNNMQKLIDRNVPFGCITVLTPSSLPFVRQTFCFFDALGLDFRALPYDVSASADQANLHSLSGEALVDAFAVLFDEWLGSSSAVKLEPLCQYMLSAIRFLRGEEKNYWNMWEDELVFIVELDGSLWGRPDMYVPGSKYGNVIEQNLESVLQSASRRRACEQAAQRTDLHCRECPYHGYCSGQYVADASNVEREMLSAFGCPVRSVIDHIVARFEETGLISDIRLGDLQGDGEGDLAVATAIRHA